MANQKGRFNLPFLFSLLKIFIFMSFRVPSVSSESDLDGLPKILTQDGNLILSPAQEGSVFVQSKTDKINLTDLYYKIQTTEEKVHSLEAKVLVSDTKLQILQTKLEQISQLLHGDCDNSPCKNGGSCVQQVGKFECTCTPQWKGPTCEEDVDECIDENPCENRGRCVNQLGTFRCLCSGGWTGDVCDVHTKKCGSSICYHGQCSRPANSSSGSNDYCICDTGYTGINCRRRINYCSSNPCQNGGRCRNRINGFRCICSKGYFGTSCEGYHNASCSAREFQCEEFVDECIPRETLCDGRYNCGDGSDEWRCCGKTYSGVSGYIRSPVSNFTHDNCKWTIQVPAKKHVQLSFLTFQLASLNCLYVYDSANTAQASLIRVLCGLKEDQSFTSTGNVMTVVLHQNQDLRRFEYFEAVYTATDVTPTCGATRKDDNGVIRTPDFPDQTTDKVNCSWIIEAPQAHHILLNITHFHIKSSSGCATGSLKIRAGSYPNSLLIGQYCGQTRIPVMYSHSNLLSLTFELNDDNMQGLLSLTYSFMASGCGAEMTAVSDSFTSPRYPLPPINSIECLWDIVLAKGSTIQLEFPVMNLTDSDEDCTTSTGNYIQVMESTMKVAKILCGNTTPDKIISSSNKLIIKYLFTNTADVHTAGTGFLATYTSVCHNELTGWRGVIESPNFPSPYPPNLNCTWTVKSLPHTLISFVFSHFQVKDISSNCEEDFLLIQTRNSSGRSLIGRYCGFHLPPNMNITGDEVLITFTTSATRSSLGFRLEYLHIGCGGELTTQEGILSASTLDRHCYWTITVDPTMSINMTIDQLDYSGGCDKAKLEIDDGVRNKSTICGSTHSYLSAENKLTVRYDGNSSSGFKAHYKAVKRGCGGNYWTESGDISSMHNYTKFTDCDWFITVPQGRVVLTITDVDMEKSPSCVFDFIKVYDGADSSSPLLQTLCGRKLPSNNIINSTGTRMYIHMASNGNDVSGRGFSANYKTGFGGTIFVDGRGEITSPYFQSMTATANDNSTASWILHTFANDKIVLTFSSIYLNKSNDVCDGWVEVRDGIDKAAPSIGRFCGVVSPQPITSHGSSLYVIFRGSNSIGNRGFRAEYSRLSTGCGGTYTAPNGTLASPGYPDSAPANMDCAWTIRSSPGSHINLQFTNITLSSYRRYYYYVDCSQSFIEVREGSESGLLVRKICGNSDVNDTRLMNLATVWIRLVSTSALDTSFVLEYYTVYGGYLTGSSGQIASPLYPEPAPHPSHVKWTIMTYEEDKVIKADFRNLGDTLSCTGGVSLRKVNDVMSSPAFYNDQQDLCSFFSDTREIEVTFDSDYHDFGRGFLLNWTSVLPESSLPDVMKLDAAESVSNLTNTVNKVWQYSSNQNETWIITAPFGNKVWFNITVMAMEFSIDCMADVLHVYDGSLPTPRKKLGSFCGSVGNQNVLLSTQSVMTIQFLTDSSLNNRGFVAEYKAVCGMEFESPVGIIESPRFPNNYPPLTNCVWTISTNPGNSIHLQLNKTFNVISSNMSECEEDYIMIRDGGSANSPALGPNLNGRYCGNQAPSPSESSGRAVYVEFNSNAATSGSGFQLNFSRMQAACGGHIKMTEMSNGYISNPGYPLHSQMSAECVWVIIAPPHRSIQLDFQSFDLSSPLECQETFLELHDGSSQNSQQIWRKCGKQSVSTVKSTGNALFVLFRTTNKNSFRGFRAKYQLASCGGTYYDSQGSFTYPLSPLYKDYTADCEWFIEVPNSQSVKMNISLIGSVAERQEAVGTIKIGESPDKAGTSLHNLPSQQYSLYNNKAYIHLFHTGSLRLQVHYMAVPRECGDYLDSPSGIFSSPNYPDVHAHNDTCVWLIEVDPGKRISLSFLTFELENSSRCVYDYVDVFDGLLDDSNLLGHYCGTDVPSVIQSSQNTMSVVFQSDKSIAKHGFQAEYSSHNDAVCGGTIFDLNGTLSFPEFSLGNKVDCTWRISVPQAPSTIKIVLNEFLFVYNCSQQFLEIREGADEKGILVTKLCGNVTEENNSYFVMGPDVWIRFRTAESNISEGFNLSYSTYDCGGIHQDSTTISSPGYGSYSSDNITCVWLIQLPEGQQVELNFNRFYFTSSDNVNCSKDYLKVLNGGSPTSPIIGKYCENNYGLKLISSSNMMRLLFEKDGLSSRNGFKLQFGAHTAGCGGIYHSSIGSLDTLGKLSCSWEIYVKPSHHVDLQINSLYLPDTRYYWDNCRYNYLEITESLSNGTEVTLAKLCKGTNITSVQSGGAHMRIQYRTSYRSEGNFSATWTSSCGQVYTEQTGLVVSPGYPNSYTNNLTCNYSIIPNGAEHKTVIVQFTDIDLPGDCKDSVYYMDRKISFCGSTLPNPITSDGSVNLQFKSDGSDVHRGFRAQYWVTECGGIYNDPSGQIKSPSHPMNYGNSYNCTWIITVVNRSVRLKFQKFGFSECSQNYLEIRDGSTATSPVIGHLCGSDFPKSIVTRGSVMSVYMETESVGKLASFQALYDSVIGEGQGCGGILEGSGTFRSPDLDDDGEYENNLDCFWIISADEGETVKLTISELSLDPNGQNKRYDYLEVYDGLEKTDPVLGSYSVSHSSVIVLKSSSNTMSVYFHTDFNRVESGFIAIYNSID